MENTNEINRVLAKQLTHYRKEAGFTQAELAEKISYSDKSVSKWESGNGVPDIYTLVQLAKLYGVTVDAFLGGETPVQRKKRTKSLHTLIMLLSSGIVWLIATCFFVAVQFLLPGYPWWTAFLYAVAINAVVLIVYACVWKYRILNFIAITVLIWMSLTCLFLTALFVSKALGNTAVGLWSVFLIGVPLQILEILWVFFRSLFKKNKKLVVSQPSAPAPEKEEDGEKENGEK